MLIFNSNFLFLLNVPLTVQMHSKPLKGGTGKEITKIDDEDEDLSGTSNEDFSLENGGGNAPTFDNFTFDAGAHIEPDIIIDVTPVAQPLPAESYLQLNRVTNSQVIDSLTNNPTIRDYLTYIRDPDFVGTTDYTLFNRVINNNLTSNAINFLYTKLANLKSQLALCDLNSTLTLTQEFRASLQEHLSGIYTPNIVLNSVPVCSIQGVFKNIESLSSLEAVNPTLCSIFKFLLFISVLDVNLALHFKQVLVNFNYTEYMFADAGCRIDLRSVYSTSYVFYNFIRLTALGIFADFNVQLRTGPSADVAIHTYNALKAIFADLSAQRYQSLNILIHTIHEMCKLKYITHHLVSTVVTNPTDAIKTILAIGKTNIEAGVVYKR